MFASEVGSSRSTRRGARKARSQSARWGENLGADSGRYPECRDRAGFEPCVRVASPQVIDGVGSFETLGRLPRPDGAALNRPVDAPSSSRAGLSPDSFPFPYTP